MAFGEDLRQVLGGEEVVPDNWTTTVNVRTERIEVSMQEHKEMQHKVKVQMAKAKQRAHKDLQARLDSKEGEY